VGRHILFWGVGSLRSAFTSREYGLEMGMLVSKYRRLGGGCQGGK